MRRFGIGVPRDSLYFGSSQSMFEGSSIESDADDLLRLADWVSDANDPMDVFETVVDVLSNGNRAKGLGFTKVLTLTDYVLDAPAQKIYYVVAATAAIVGLLHTFGIL